jgi:hypothetical protein
MLAVPAPAQQEPGEPRPPGAAAEEPKEQAPKTTEAHTPATLGRAIKGSPLLDDLDQFRSLLNREWMLSNLNDADFGAAIDAIAQDAPAGMTLAELTIRLQRVLAMGSDGHAEMGQFSGAMQTVRGVRPDFLIDMSGDGYTAYRVEHAAGGPVNPALEHRFVPLKEGYPHLLAIDGKPIAEWVRAASPYIYKGPAPAVRWRAMRILQELPFLRREMGLPDAPAIRARLASPDGEAEVEIEAPTNPYQRWHFAVPRPDWRILDGNIGHLWIKDPASGGAEAIVRGMPELRDTRGLIIDLRDNGGGAGLDTLQLICGYLLPPDHPRIAAGRIIHWQGDRWSTNTGEISTETEGLSAEGRRFLEAFERRFERRWQPPKGRPTESRTVFLARAEAEPNLFPYNHDRWPKSSPYTAPVVVLFNHRCFSAAEIFLAGIREAPGVTLVGSASTAGGGGSSELYRLRHSGLDVILSHAVFVRRDDTPIDGRGIVPDVVVEPDADYYLGGRDRMLERAVDVLKEKIHARK